MLAAASVDTPAATFSSSSTLTHSPTTHTCTTIDASLTHTLIRTGIAAAAAAATATRRPPAQLGSIRHPRICPTDDSAASESRLVRARPAPGLGALTCYRFAPATSDSPAIIDRTSAHRTGPIDQWWGRS
ncbi:hypothetical protein Y032_0049g1756 [Ancylostoma ceylanicum]|nr:hypothetical protein Y032_0049g1756 [Ancylostoma ceylanicum]